MNLAADFEFGALACLTIWTPMRELPFANDADPRVREGVADAAANARA